MKEGKPVLSTNVPGTGHRIDIHLDAGPQTGKVQTAPGSAGERVNVKTDIETGGAGAGRDKKQETREPEKIISQEAQELGYGMKVLEAGNDPNRGELLKVLSELVSHPDAFNALDSAINANGGSFQLFGFVRIDAALIQQISNLITNPKDKTNTQAIAERLMEDDLPLASNF